MQLRKQHNESPETEITPLKKLQKIKEVQKHFHNTEGKPVWLRYRSDLYLYRATWVLLLIGVGMSAQVMWELSYVRHFKGRQ